MERKGVKFKKENGIPYFFTDSIIYFIYVETSKDSLNKSGMPAGHMNLWKTSAIFLYFSNMELENGIKQI